jgi:NADH-quinone oxidoreductase subunit H
VRWSWPRFRFDQLMALAWKVMLPLGLVNFVVIAILEQLKTTYGLQQSITFNIALAIVAWATCIIGWIGISVLGPIIADNRPRHDLDVADVDAQV